MKKEIQEWQIAAVRGAYFATRSVYGHSPYSMMCEYKNGRGWKFLGYSIPGIPKEARFYLKETPSGKYLYVERTIEDIQRYRLNELTKNLLEVI